MIVLVDNGHGRETPCKRSPDNSLFEWKWAREMARRLVCSLSEHGIDARQLTPEDTDVPLRVRVQRVNDVCRKRGADNVLLVSIHNNASSGDGKWHKARGFLILYIILK